MLNKKSAKKTLQLRVMIQHEVFGEEELIKSYFDELKSAPNQQVPKDFNPNLFRSYSVQCSSTQGTLIKISKEDLFRKIVGKMRYDQIKDLVLRIDSKLKNRENKVRKIRKSIIPFKQYLISESFLDSSNDLSKQTPRSSHFNRPSSVSYSQTPKILGSNSSNLSIGNTSRRNLIDISGCATTTNVNQSTVKRSLTPSTQPHRNTTNNSQILTIKITNDSFSDKLSLIQRAVSQIETVKTSSTLFSSNTPKQSPLNTPRSRPYSAKALDKENTHSDNSPNISGFRHASSRPASSSIFCSMKKLNTNNLKNTQQIQSFTNLEPTNLSISQNLNVIPSKENLNDHVKEVTSKVFYDEKSIQMKKRFSVYEKSTMETSFNQQTETLLKSPRLKIQLGIQRPERSNKSLDMTNQEKKLMKFEDKLKRKVSQSKPITKASFVEFVPQPDPKKQDKKISEKVGASPTYSGLNTKVIDTVKKRNMKIELIQPIFDRGYAENFNKELIKLNRRNAKHNYIIDVKEDNKAKGLSKFSLLQQIMEKQNKLKQMQQLQNDNQNANISFHPHSSNILSITSQQNLNTNVNSNFLSVNTKENYQNHSLLVSESMIIPPFQHLQSPRLSQQQQINTNSAQNSSQILSSPILSPRGYPQSVQITPVSSPLKSKTLKNTFDMLQKLVDDKTNYPQKGFVGLPNHSRSKSYSIKSPVGNNHHISQYLQPNFSLSKTNLISPKGGKPVMSFIAKGGRLRSPSSQPPLPL